MERGLLPDRQVVGRRRQREELRPLGRGEALEGRLLGGAVATQARGRLAPAPDVRIRLRQRGRGPPAEEVALDVVDARPARPSLYVPASAARRARGGSRSARISASQPEHTWYIGDSLVNDIAGAAGAGWRTCWISAPDAPIAAGLPAPDARITRLDELPQVISQYE